MTMDEQTTSQEISHENEVILVNKALSGDQNAMTEIVLQHQRNVYNLALKLTGREDEAECILQDTFLKVFEKLSEFRQESRLGTWIHRIATNVALMRMRSRKNKYFVQIEEQPSDDEESYDLGHIAQSFDRDPLEQTLGEELKHNLGLAIRSLPAHLRLAFVLKDLEGMSLVEIAERVDKSVPAVKADLHRARLRLRRELAEFVEGGHHD